MDSFLRHPMVRLIPFYQVAFHLLSEICLAQTAPLRTQTPPRPPVSAGIANSPVVRNSAVTAGGFTSGVIKVVFEGDSWTLGGGWTDVLFAAFPGATKVNVAASGGLAENMVGEFATQIAPHAPAKGQTSWVVLLAGVNDLYHFDAKRIYGNLKSIWASARKSGFKVCAVAVPDCGFISGYSPAGQKVELASLNLLIRENPALYDALLPADKWFPDALDATYYSPDQLHLNAEGTKTFGNYAAAYMTTGVVGATALSPEIVSALAWRENLQRFSAEYGATFQPVDLDRFTQVAAGSGTTFTPAYFGDYFFSVSNSPGNSGGLMGRYPSNTTADNIGWDTTTQRGIMVHARTNFGTQADGIVRVLVGTTYNQISGPLERTGFGFECQDANATYRIRAVAHNGSTLTSGAWVPRFSGNAQWFAFCSAGTVTLWERITYGGEWFDWSLLQSITGGPVVATQPFSSLVRITAEVGPSPSEGTLAVDLVQVVLTLGLDRPSNVRAR